MSSAILARAGWTALLALFVCHAAAAAKNDDVGPSEAERRAFAASASDEIERWATIAANGGLRDAQLLLGEHYLRRQSQPKDAERAIEWLERASAQGSARAQALLGWVYWGGVEAKRDAAEAIRWFTIAARQEDGFSLTRLAQFYYNGVGVPPDQPRARRLMLRAAELGYPEGIVGAWNMLLITGTPDQRDPRFGMYFLVKGANADDANSAYALAREYLTGRDVARDPARAVEWFTRAAKSKHTLASLWLSELHAKGIGMKQDRARGEQMLQAALRDARIGDKNQFSWDLSVAPDVQLRNAALAIRVIEPALASQQQKSFAHLDTLAAAYAEHGQFDKAVATQMEALATFRRARPKEELPPRMQERLELYRTGKSYHEDTLW